MSILMRIRVFGSSNSRNLDGVEATVVVGVLE